MLLSHVPQLLLAKTILIVLAILSVDAVEFSSAHFGSGTGSIYLDNVGCSGSESRLIDCSRNSVVSCSNGHLEDAGVRCQGQTCFSEILHENAEYRLLFYDL